MKTYLALALMVLLGLPALAQAQEIDSYTEAQKWKLARIQLVETLESPVEGIREQSLKNAIIFATLYRDKVDLGGAVSAISEVYENDNRRVNRKLALAALQAIGDYRATDYLARHVEEAETEEGRALVATVLSEYYVAKASAPQ